MLAWGLAAVGIFLVLGAIGWFRDRWEQKEAQRSWDGYLAPEASFRKDIWFDGRKWRARVRLHDESVFLGKFATERLAHAAYLDALERYGVKAPGEGGLLS